MLFFVLFVGRCNRRTSLGVIWALCTRSSSVSGGPTKKNCVKLPKNPENNPSGSTSILKDILENSSLNLTMPDRWASRRSRVQAHLRSEVSNNFQDLSFLRCSRRGVILKVLRQITNDTYFPKVGIWGYISGRKIGPPLAEKLSWTPLADPRGYIILPPGGPKFWTPLADFGNQIFLSEF